jgi:adenosylmethionine-8-amino-7-oxononanoate aminotransferase
VTPDILVLAKGLAGGYQPIGAMLVSGPIVATLQGGSSVLRHGFTYSGHAIACAAALKVQKIIVEEDLSTKVSATGAELHGALKDRFGNHPHIGDIRGRGLLLALEFVRERSSKITFEPELQLNLLIKKEAFDRGLMVYPMGGTADGKSGDHVLLAPPYIIGSSQIEELVQKLGDAIDAAIGRLN